MTDDATVQLIVRLPGGNTIDDVDLRYRIEDAIVGCAIPEAEQGLNVARIAVLARTVCGINVRARQSNAALTSLVLSALCE